jgi:hypothetical protein
VVIATFAGLPSPNSRPADIHVLFQILIQTVAPPIHSIFVWMFGVETAILFGTSTSGQPQVRVVNRCKTKSLWVDGSFVEKSLRHYRAEDRPQVVSPEPIVGPETQNSDGILPSLVENVWESVEGCSFEWSQDGDGFGTSIWN